MTVLEHVLLALSSAAPVGLPRQEVEQEALEMLDFVGLVRPRENVCQRPPPR